MAEALVGSALFSAGGTAVGTTGLFGAAGSLGAGGVFGTVGAGLALGKSLLPGILMGASAFGQIQAGNMNANILGLQAQQSELNARMETLKGRQQALQIKNQLDRDLASQNATFAARGVLQGEGSALAASDASKQNAEDDLNVAQFGAAMGSESDKLQATQNRMEAGAAKTGGVIKAVNTIASYRPAQSLLSGI